MSTLMIVIDGPAGSGKGTAAAYIAEKLGIKHVDSGLFYRAVGLIAFDTGTDPGIVAGRLSPSDLEHHELRGSIASREAANVGPIPKVRLEINRKIREMYGESGFVIDGRAGIDEFLEATVRIYLTAQNRKRAKRRVEQLQQSGTPANFADVHAELQRRDKRDMTRSVGRLRSESEAHGLYDYVINSSNLTLDETLRQVLAACESRLVKV